MPKRPKIALIGAGNIGGELAILTARRELGDAILVDISRTWENDDFEAKHLPNYHDGFVHVNSKGNRNKALLLADTIVSQNLISCGE